MIRPGSEGRAASRVEAGLRITDRGLSGFIVEMTDGYGPAISRQEQVIRFVDQRSGPVGGLLLLSLPTNEAILDRPMLEAATNAGTSSAYEFNGVACLEWSVGDGWLDRRHLSPRTAALIAENGGPAVSDASWRWATAALRGLRGDQAEHEIWSGFLADAQTWWFTRLPGPMFGHAIGLRRFQLLPRAALARVASGRPQVVDERKIGELLTDDLLRAQAGRLRSASLESLDELVAFAGRTARAKPSKDHGRRLIREHICMLLPIAAREGRNQFIVLSAVGHAIDAGGVRGGLWAPVTIYEYLRLAPREIVEALVELDFDSLDGHSWYELYHGLLGQTRESQRGKFAAFLEIFHRYLVIAGAEPLPRCLSGRGVQLPPAAAVISEHELDLALAYVKAHAPTDRVRLQAEVALVVGFWIPLRPVELWCIRLGDVEIRDPMYLVVYPRRRDGAGKSFSVRRQEELADLRLRTLLTDLVLLRRRDGADREDVLLGQPGQPDGRHEEAVTMGLVNRGLRWATGDASASYYDLRHTAFSRRAEESFSGAANGQ